MSSGSRQFFMIAVVVFLASGVCLGNEKKLTWCKHKDITCADTTITGWHSTSTTKLQTDDDGSGEADFACNTTLTKDGDTKADWDAGGVGAQPETNAECVKAFDSLKDLGYICGVVTSIKWDSQSCLALRGGAQNTILCTAAMPGVALAHEVGHLAGIAGDYKPGITSRIMNAALDGSENRVICDERTKFLAL